ncbi:MAG: TetR/AcrR family transcriptional regulator [Pseudomonadota bacterium]
MPSNTGDTDTISDLKNKRSGDDHNPTPSAYAISDKERAIINAAREIFLENGFDGASMDTIAITAGVSKRTVYNRFQSKEKLFAATIEETCKRILPVSVDTLDISEPIEKVVRVLAEKILRGLLQPDVISLRRIATFEAGRKPEVGQSFLEHGLHFMLNSSADMLGKVAEANNLKIDDTYTAVCQLGALLTEPLYSEMLFGAVPQDLDAAVEKQLAGALKMFWNAYGDGRFGLEPSAFQ